MPCATLDHVQLSMRPTYIFVQSSSTGNANEILSGQPALCIISGIDQD
jgi:hypothetical protein